MEYYVYLISDFSHRHIQAGYCSDMTKMVTFYNKMNEMSLYPSDEKYINRLVYFEEVNKEGDAINRLMFFTFIPLTERIKLIEEVNPTFMDLTTASNYPFKMPQSKIEFNGAADTEPLPLPF